MTRKILIGLGVLLLVAQIMVFVVGGLMLMFRAKEYDRQECRAVGIQPVAPPAFYLPECEP